MIRRTFLGRLLGAAAGLIGLGAAVAAEPRRTHSGSELAAEALDALTNHVRGGGGVVLPGAVAAAAIRPDGTSAVSVEARVCAAAGGDAGQLIPPPLRGFRRESLPRIVCRDLVGRYAHFVYEDVEANLFGIQGGQDVPPPS